MSCLENRIVTLMNKRRVGADKEALAEAYLKKKGVKIVCKNYRVRQGEIDLIGWEKNTLLFIEVKYRKNNKAGSALEAVGYAKKKQISRVSLFYLNQKRLDMNISMRYDVIAIEGELITWVKNAFSYCG